MCPPTLWIATIGRVPEDIISAHRAARRILRAVRPHLADLRAAVRLTLLVGLGGLMLWAFVPYAFGWHTTLVTSGSMEPAVRTGDLVVIAPLDPATVRRGKLKGAVVQVDDPAHPGRLLLHRVVGRERDNALITKGDNNPTRDYAPVRPDQVRGAARLRVPFAGLPMLWMQNGQKVPLVALGLAILLLAWPERNPAPAPRRTADADIPTGPADSSRRATTDEPPSPAAATRSGQQHDDNAS